MTQLVTVSSVEDADQLKTYINDLFSRRQYAEISQAIGMHSILVDPENMIGDQNHLYRLALNLLKNMIVTEYGSRYSSWLIAFPSLLARLVQTNSTVTDEAARSALSSRYAAFGPFSSLDEFYFWALDDRRLPLEQIIAFVRKTLEMHRAS